MYVYIYSYILVQFLWTPHHPSMCTSIHPCTPHRRLEPPELHQHRQSSLSGEASAWPTKTATAGGGFAIAEEEPSPPKEAWISRRRRLKGGNTTTAAPTKRGGSTFSRWSGWKHDEQKATRATTKTKNSSKAAAADWQTTRNWRDLEAEDEPE